MPLADALCGTASVRVPTLDLRIITVPLHDVVVTPGYVKVVKGEGMPLSKTPGQCGDLLIRCALAFPAQPLADDKKRLLRAALS